MNMSGYFESAGASPCAKPGLVGALARERRGAAAVEMALILPFLAGAFMAMVDVGEAINAKYQVEQKVRLAIEGVQRYGDDTDKVTAFANTDGSSAFSGANDASVNEATVSVTAYYVCRAADGTTAEYDASANASAYCPDYETWFRIAATGSSEGIFGRSYDINTSIDLLAN